MSTDMELDPKSPDQDKGPSARRAGGGPGRRSRACLECKKLKMKCEIPPGGTTCRHCLRRCVDCLFSKRSYYNVRHDALDRQAPEDVKGYEQKIDAMRTEIQQMRQMLDAVLTDRSGENIQAVSVSSPISSRTNPRISESALHEEQQAAQTLLTVNQQQKTPLLDTPGSTTSPAGLSGREDNTQMAMTRENSVEPPSNGDLVNGPVTLEDPMGSLYEVTRLRNIRSNKSKMTRTCLESQDELNDFISRGVISEAEAEELYETQVNFVNPLPALANTQSSFHRSLNHYLWVGLEQTHPSFNSVRKSSELLTATILTVTALHIPTSAATFDVCYKEFLSLISSSMFSRYHSIDDVRGLCIAAFWLSEVSWKLSGHAIRIATELNIHQSFSRALEGDKEHFLRARLWYMLYVCDHHFSIAYGRPPMIAESIQIREHELFLQSPYADALDARILSQVNLMQILTRVYERFAEKRTSTLGQARVGLQSRGGSTVSGPAPFAYGARPPTALTSAGPPAGLSINSGVYVNGVEATLAASTSPQTSIRSTPGHDGGISCPQTSSNGNGTMNSSSSDPAATMLDESDFDALRGFNLEIDQWRMLWCKRQTTNHFIGGFPPMGIILYSYFAKLQINSLAVRGVSLATSPGGTGSGRLSTERKEFASMAVSAAASILTFVLEEDDMRRALVGTPLYVHTMIAFASVFLMKVTTKWNRFMGLNIEEAYVSRLLRQMIGVLKSAITSDRHVIRHIAAGLEKMLVKMDESRAQRESVMDGLGAGAVQDGTSSSQAAEGRENMGYYGATVEGSVDPSFQFGQASLGRGRISGTHTPITAPWAAGPARVDFFEDGMVDNNDMIYEAFGSGSANDLYELLSTQFSF